MISYDSIHTYTTPPPHTPHAHIRIHAYIHTYAYTHTHTNRKVDKKHTIIHNTKKQKVNALFVLSLVCVCTHAYDTPLFWVFSVWFNTK